jgi:hypothetical protein
MIDAGIWKFFQFPRLEFLAIREYNAIRIFDCRLEIFDLDHLDRAIENLKSKIRLGAA